MKRLPLRVSYVVMATPVPATSGYAVRAQTIAEALSRIADLRLLVLSQTRDDAAAQATRARFRTDVVDPAPRPKLVKAAVHVRAALSSRNRWMEKFRTGRLRAEAVAALEAFSPDVVVFGHTAIASLIPAWGVGYDRAIIDHHNVETLNYTRMMQASKGLGKVAPAIDVTSFRRIEAQCGAASDQWAVSEPDCARLAQLTGAPVALVPNVAPDASFAICARGTHPDAPPVLGFVGSYGYFPNRGAALELCELSAALTRRSVAHRTLILGKDAPDALRERGKAVGAEVLGFVPDPTPIYEKLTVTVAPIRSGSGTKLKIVESLAMGIPVVTTTVGAEGLPIAELDLGIVTDSFDSLTDAVADLLADRPRVAAMGARARRWAQCAASTDHLTETIYARLCRVRAPERVA